MSIAARQLQRVIIVGVDIRACFNQLLYGFHVSIAASRDQLVI
jgi:hypothetical protein